MSSHANTGMVDLLAKKYLAETDPARKEALFEQFSQSLKQKRRNLDGLAFAGSLGMLLGVPVLIMIAHTIFN